MKKKVGKKGVWVLMDNVCRLVSLNPREWRLLRAVVMRGIAGHIGEGRNARNGGYPAVSREAEKTAHALDQLLDRLDQPLSEKDGLAIGEKKEKEDD
jgi:hypothetical protein